jgi:hypothetical protein
VTYYNAPDADKLRTQYENLPAKLRLLAGAQNQPAMGASKPAT